MSDALSEARSLVSRARYGSLATLAPEPAGHPFGSLVAYALLPSYEPVMLLSALAEHTKNLEADARASLLVTDTAADPLAAGRVTLLGRVARIDDPAAARAAFLAAHPGAAQYVDFRDFAFHALHVASARWVGGFGRMTWIDGADWHPR